MHHIQSKILHQLTYAKELRYAQLRPDNTESNLFAYHLREVQKDGFVAKTSAGAYSLTPQGKSYVGRLSHETFRFREQPSIVTILVIKNQKGEYILTKRKIQPYIDMIGFPSGKLHLSEDIATAAHRELREKVGDVSVELTHAGMAYIEIREQDVFISEVLGHVFVGAYTEGACELIENEKVTPAWYQLEVCPPGEIIPGTQDLATLAESGEFFFRELQFDLAH